MWYIMNDMSVHRKDAGGRNRVAGSLFPGACARQLLRYGASSLDAALVNHAKNNYRGFLTIGIN